MLPPFMQKAARDKPAARVTEVKEPAHLCLLRTDAKCEAGAETEAGKSDTTNSGEERSAAAADAPGEEE